MRKLSLFFLLTLGLVTSSHANQIVFHESQLPYDSKTATCEIIIKNANVNKYAMIEAAHLLMSGKRMGKKCVDVDYIKAFELWKKAGYPEVVERTLKGLKVRADDGHNRSRSWVRKLKKAGYEFKR